MKNKQRYILLLSALCLSWGVSAQKRVFQNLDSSGRSNSYVEGGITAAVFLKGNECRSDLNPLELDNELSDATLFSFINDIRRKRGRKPLKFSNELYSIVYAFLTGYSGGKFRSDSETKLKMNRPIPKAADILKYDKGIIKAFFFSVKLLDHPSFKAFHHDKTGPDNELNLFKGNNPDPKKGEEKIKPEDKEPLDMFTYHSFCKYFYKEYLSRYNKYVLTKTMSDMSCGVMVDSATLFRARIPEAKIVVIFAAKRLEMVK